MKIKIIAIQDGHDDHLLSELTIDDKNLNLANHLLLRLFAQAVKMLQTAALHRHKADKAAKLINGKTPHVGA